MIFQIVIEGHDSEQMQAFFEEIQNKYSLYDNCVLQEVDDEDTIIDLENNGEFGDLIINGDLKNFKKR